MARNERAVRIQAVKRRIVPVSQAEQFVKVLVYGVNGAGKTRFAATAPKPLIIDINEKGTDSVKDYPGVDVFHAKTWADVVYAFWFLHEGGHGYDSVVIDNLTSLQNMCMRHVLKENSDRDPNKDPTTPTQRDWGKLAELLKPRILDFRNLDMHVIFIAQERILKDKNEEGEDSVDSVHVPDMSPGSRGVAMGAVGVIGRIYQRELTTTVKGKEKSVWEPRMLVGPHESYITKDRTGNLGRIVRNPTVPKIIAANNTTRSK